MGNKERKGGKICGARNFDVFYTQSWSFGHGHLVIFDREHGYFAHYI